MRVAPRSDLIANREKQHHYRQRAHAEAFGIYRPLAPESERELAPALLTAKKAIYKFLERRRNGPSAQLETYDQMGSTFVMKTQVKKAMRHGLLQRGFELRRLLEHLDPYTDAAVLPPLEVPILDVKWAGVGNRKLVASFVARQPGFINPLLAEQLDDPSKHTDAYEDLRTQSTIVKDCMVRLHAGTVPVRAPDHISLGRYGFMGDCLDLSRDHKAAVADILHDTLASANIGAVVLNPLVVGSSYNQPLHHVADLAQSA